MWLVATMLGRVGINVFIIYNIEHVGTNKHSGCSQINLKYREQ